MAQVLALGVAGSVFGIVLAKLALLGVGRYFADSLPANMSQSLRTGTVIQGLLLGLLVSLLFSALPLLRIRHIRPNMLLRNDEDVLTVMDFSLCNLCAPCGAMVGVLHDSLTTEKQRTQHRELSIRPQPEGLT